MTRSELVKILKVLADKTRINVLSNIYMNPDISGKELLVMQKISQPTLSFHLSKLEQINIIKSKKVGQSHYYVVNHNMIHDSIKTVHNWIGFDKMKK